MKSARWEEDDMRKVIFVLALLVLLVSGGLTGCDSSTYQRESTYEEKDYTAQIQSQIADAEGNTKPTYVETEITVSQVKLDKRLCEDWSIPEDY